MKNDSGMPLGKDLTGQIVNVQRRIPTEEMSSDLTNIPHMWRLYKEGQDFCSEGPRTPRVERF